MGGVILAFFFYWLLLFVACFILNEYGYFYLYDEKPKNGALKCIVASVLLAAMATWTRSSFDTMFTSDILRTILQAIVWFGVFVIVLQFHPWHALGVGLAAMVLTVGVSSMAVDSLTTKSHRVLPDAINHSNKPYRASMSSGPAAVRVPEKGETKDETKTEPK